MTVFNCYSHKLFKPCQSFVVLRISPAHRIDHNDFTSGRIDCDQVPVATLKRCIVDWEQNHVKVFGRLISRDALCLDHNIEGSFNVG